MLSARSDAKAKHSPRPAKGAASTEIKALKEAHTTEAHALKSEHRTALKEAVFEEHRKHQDKQQEVVVQENCCGGPRGGLGPQGASDQEKALRVQLEGRLAQGQSQADRLKTHPDAQTEMDMTAQWRELYQSMATKGSSTQS